MEMNIYYKIKYMPEWLKEMLGSIGVFVGFICLLGAVLIFGGFADTHYTSTAIVTSNENGIVTMVDASGDVWTVKNRNDLHKDDFVDIFFNTHLTDYTRKDDIILRVKALDN